MQLLGFLATTTTNLTITSLNKHFFRTLKKHNLDEKFATNGFQFCFFSFLLLTNTGLDTATEQLAVPAQPHPVTTQQSSSYEEEEESEAPAARKASTSSSSAASSASSKASVGSRDVDDQDQADLLETAEQELLDEMIVREDVPELPVPVPVASAPPTIQEEQSKIGKK